MRSPVACRIAAAALLCLVVVTASAQTETAAQSAAAKKERIVGTIKSINANTLIVATDSGSDVSVTIAPTTRMVRMEPGQTDLKSAPTVQLSDVQAGDRILAQGMASEGGKALAATTAVIMKKLDVAEKQQRERE